MFHPRDPDVIFAGYESSEIYRSDDGGDHWAQLPVSVRFPEVTVGPGANLAKRVLMMSASVADPNELYGAIEVGGIIRSTDGGDHWENLSHGQYINDDPVDMHGVLASSFRPGTVLSIGRAGMFRSDDRGDHWSRVPIDALNDKGQTYCRYIRETPGDNRNVWVAAGPNFQADTGILFHSPGRRGQLAAGGTGSRGQQHPLRRGFRRGQPPAGCTWLPTVGRCSAAATAATPGATTRCPRERPQLYSLACS